MGQFFPVIDSIAFRPFIFLLLCGGLAFINIRSTKNGVRFIIFTTLAKLLPLLLLIIFGVSHISSANLQWKTAFTFNDVGATTLILFYAFLGIETSVTDSGEFKNPSRVVPGGILSGLSFVLLIYISIQLIAQGTLGDQLLSFKDAPLTEVSKRLFGYVGIIFITIGIAVSMIGSFGMLLHYGLGDNLYKLNLLPFNMDGTTYKRNCKDLRIKLAGYPDTLFQKVHRRCRVWCSGITYRSSKMCRT